MIYNCKDCGTLWTTRQTTNKVDPKRAKSQICNDCATFDWPNYKKRLDYAKSLRLGKSEKKAEAKSK